MQGSYSGWPLPVRRCQVHCLVEILRLASVAARHGPKVCRADLLPRDRVEAPERRSDPLLAPPAVFSLMNREGLRLGSGLLMQNFEDLLGLAYGQTAVDYVCQLAFV